MHQPMVAVAVLHTVLHILLTVDPAVLVRAHEASFHEDEGFRGVASSLGEARRVQVLLLALHVSAPDPCNFKVLRQALFFSTGPTNS